MKKKLHHYVGRIVRLNHQLFQEVASRAKKQGTILENSFLVSGVSTGVRRLICYGASFRIVVDIADVVLV